MVYKKLEILKAVSKMHLARHTEAGRHPRARQPRPNPPQADVGGQAVVAIRFKERAHPASGGTPLSNRIDA